MAIQNNFPAIRPTLLLDFANTGRLDPRITFTRASSATFFDQLGVLQTAASGAARFTYDPATLAPQGLLIEEQRTNSIRNNTMQGAVAGTPGTLPTNWGVGGGGGLTREIVGIGTENGITYIDVKFSGTSSSTELNIRFEGNSQISAANSQAWTSSLYCKLVGGSLANVTTVRQSIIFNDNLGSPLTINATVFTPTAAALTTQRQTTIFTAANASTAFVISRLDVLYTNGSAIDITLRIGLPQLELGAFATSVIPTTTTALTRNADVASMTGTNFSSWYNASEGTLYAEVLLRVAPNLAGNIIGAISDNTNNNRMQLGASTASSGNLNFIVTDSGVIQANPLVGSISSVGPHKVAGAFAVNSFQISLNGALGTQDSSGTVPTTVNALQIGSAGNPNAQGNLWLRRIAYYPQRLPNAQLQALTG